MVFSLPEDASDAGRQLRDALSPLTEGSEPLILDGGSVGRVSTATLQVLLAAIHAAEQRGIAVRWQSVSSVLHESAECLGLTTALHLLSPAARQEDLNDGEYPGG